LAVRSVEWLRDNHAGFVVAIAEDIWYTLTQPPEGGPARPSLPTRTGASPAGRPLLAGPGLPKPASVRPVIYPALPGEGVWTPAGQTFGGKAPILETMLRPDPGHPQVVAGLAWIDTSRTRISLVPGLLEPESARPSGSGYVPLRDRSTLLATFNSGFKTRDGNGGFIAGGKTYVQPKNGLGTIAIYRDGHVEIGEWGTEIKPSSQILYLRQNLPLIVDRGAINPMVNDPWPYVRDTVGNNILVWRSGIGIDAHGGLIYVAADDITEHTLGGLLYRAGAVRAMALDENSNWVDFFTYGAPGGARPAKLLTSMPHTTDRYLAPDTRDFFVVTGREG
jgi:hypothetical protein